MKGTFNIGASVWNIIPDNNICEEAGLSVYTDAGCETIYVKTHTTGTLKLNKQYQKSLLFTNVVKILIKEFEQSYTTLDSETFNIPFSNHLMQVSETLIIDYKTLFGNFYIGCIEWKIVNHPRAMSAGNAWGRCTPELSMVQLTSEGGTCNTSISKSKATLWHEIVHAILATMGQRELYSDEHFVNLFSIFFRQFIETLKIEDDNK